MHKLRDAPSDPQTALRLRLEELAGPRRVYVLGLGYTDRADDGAGVLVANALKKTFPSFSFSEHDGVEGTVLDISEKDEEAAVFFVDAADIGEAPGTIRIIPREEINDREITTHRVAVALMASILAKAGKIPAVVGIQPKSIDFRGEVTPEVSRAVDILVRTFSEIMASRDA